MRAAKKHLKLAELSQVRNLFPHFFLFFFRFPLSLHNASVLVNVVYQQALEVALECFHIYYLKNLTVQFTQFPLY
jgi:hypothetical protein